VVSTQSTTRYQKAVFFFFFFWFNSEFFYGVFLFPLVQYDGHLTTKFWHGLNVTIAKIQEILRTI
jgi:hypothetical protein